MNSKYCKNMGSVVKIAQHAADIVTDIISNLHVHTNSFTKWKKKNNKIHDSPFCMVNAIYNANDVAFLKLLSGKVNENMYRNYRIQVYMFHCL